MHVIYVILQLSENLTELVMHVIYVIYVILKLSEKIGRGVMLCENFEVLRPLRDSKNMI